VYSIYKSVVLYNSACVDVPNYFCGGYCVVGVAESRMKYVHWPSTGFSSRSSHLEYNG